MERRLAAILMADVVGYSRLVEGDEPGTLAAIKAQREEIVQPAAGRNNGRCVKLMGDGALFEFPSATDAVACAVDIQTAVAERAEAQPSDLRLVLRIGIHVGEVVAEDGDVLGEAVNVAARLEGLAAPGGVCLSQQAYDHVEHRLDLPFRDLGAQRVKNMERPVRVWAWAPGGGRPLKPPPPPGDPGRRPSIAVLPFGNLSGDPAQEYFSDGITEDIIAALSRCRWLTVIARSSSFAFRDRAADVREIARELGVRYLLEGSVRHSGDRVRVTAQLVDGRDGSHLWSERYDRRVSDIFDLQDEISGVIAGTIEPELATLEGAALRSRPTADLGAWECYQRGLWHLYRFSVDDLEEAKTLLRRALTLDPSFAQACAQLAYAHFQLGWYGAWEDRAANMRDAIAIARRALEIDDREPAARMALGRALALTGRSDAALEELRIAVELDPNFAQGRFALGQVLCYLERPAEAIPELDAAIRLSPRDPHHWTFLHVRAICRYIDGDLDRAEQDERAALKRPNVTHYPALSLVAILGRRGRRAAASEAIAELHRLRPGYGRADARREWYFGDRPFISTRLIERYDSDLRAGGLPE